MLSSLFSSPVWQLIAMSDWVSKWIVMFGLFILSVVCVAIIIFKALTFYKENKQSATITKQLHFCSSFQELKKLEPEFGKSTSGKLIKYGYDYAQSLVKSHQHDEHNKHITHDDVEMLEIRMEQEVGKLVQEEETYLPVLGTSAAVSPLLGLFGTICGLINSFMSISQEKSADIATVAPGIASALMTTLAGLIVAIPAMIAFHYFSNELRKKENKLHEISDFVVMLVRKTFVK